MVSKLKTGQAKAKAWDSRSKSRAGELTSIAEALRLLKGMGAGAASFLQTDGMAHLWQGLLSLWTYNLPPHNIIFMLLNICREAFT